MRVSTQQFYSTFQKGISDQQSEMLKVQQQITTGQKLSGLGDDPAAARLVLQDLSTKRQVEGYNRNVDEAEQMLNSTDSIMMSITSSVQEAQELALRMSNDTYNQDDRIAAQVSVSHLRQTLVDLGNSQVGGRYIFGGLGSSGQPFAADGTFSGDTEKLSVRIGDGVTIDATVAGGEPFLDSTGNGNGIFELLDELDQALGSNDSDQIKAVHEKLLTAGTRVSRVEQNVGHSMVRLEGARTALDNIDLAADLALLETRDTDFIDASIHLQELTLGLQAALSAATQMSGLSLASLLG